MKKAIWSILVLIVVAIGISLFVRTDGTSAGLQAQANTKPKSELVSIAISSDPTDAIVTIDGRVRGRTPATVELEVGKTYQYQLRAVEPYTDYNLFRTFSSSLTPSQDTAISVWIDRTTAEEQALQRKQAEEARKKAEQERCQRQLASVALIIEDSSWYRERYGSYVTAEGRVTNNTAVTINYAKVLIEYYTDNLTFVTSDWSYLELTALLPGQSTPYKIMTRENPAMARASVRFIDRSGSELASQARSKLSCQ